MSDTRGNLAVFDVATGETRDLTTTPEWPEPGWLQFVTDAVFSPGGDRIAYSWHNEQNFNDLRVINTDGSGLRELYRDPTVLSISVKDWSPDGQHILIVLRRRDSIAQVATVPASGGSLRVILSMHAPTGELPGTMRFSPHGRYIAYDAGPRTIAPSHDSPRPASCSRAPGPAAHQSSS